MQKAFSLLKRIDARRLLLVVVLGVALLSTTACNNGNLQGARPENPPVQVGGNNAETKANRSGINQMEPPSIPAKQQRVIKRSDPNERIMEGIGKQFRESAKVINDEAETSLGQGVLNEKAKTKGVGGKDTIFDKS